MRNKKLFTIPPTTIKSRGKTPPPPLVHPDKKKKNKKIACRGPIDKQEM
jgi:hypothetical protein